jgi:glyoxylase-like metal-dependent hydrolase (beta-lactamase superfamily II)
MSMSRRAFVMDLGKGTLAVAVFGLAAVACAGEDDSGAATTSIAAAGSTEPPGTTSPATTSPQTSSPQTTAATTTSPPGDDTLTWERVDLGFVSAYILARHGEATIVDTGVEGSEGAIVGSLATLGLGWEDVSHVIVTHLHNDHQGSLPAVLDLAPDAIPYAGAADIAGIDSPRAITPVGDGDTVFGLEIIETPGHTPGHISVFDRAGGLLVAGDAMNGADGGIAGANPQFTGDMALANESIGKMAALTFETALFGHGEPVVGGASSLVRELAAGL